METVIGDAVAAGDIEIVSETYTDNWDPAIAQSTMEQVLTAENNEVDAVLAENDGMAGGVDRRARGPGPGRRRSRCPARTATTPPSTGSPSAPRPWTSGRTPASSARPPVRRPWRCARTRTSRPCAGTAPFTTPGGIDVTSILLEPIPITQDNLNVVLDAGWITEEDLCAGVEAGSVEACP